MRLKRNKKKNLKSRPVMRMRSIPNFASKNIKIKPMKVLKRKTATPMRIQKKEKKGKRKEMRYIKYKYFYSQEVEKFNQIPDLSDL